LQPQLAAVLGQEEMEVRVVVEMQLTHHQAVLEHQDKEQMVEMELILCHFQAAVVEVQQVQEAMGLELMLEAVERDF
jgi:hypothetical protein